MEKRSMAIATYDESSQRVAILRLLQRRGHASIKDLELALGVTATAVREQLSQLLAEGSITAERSRGAVGRPFYVYSLTDKGQELFPRDYGELARLILQESLDMFGQEAFATLLDRVGGRLTEGYEGQLQGKKLEEKLYALADLLGAKGFEADFAPAAEGEGFVLHESSCPFYAVVQDHPEICDMEQRMMSRVLNADVQLSTCLLEGHHGCQFKVVPREKANA